MQIKCQYKRRERTATTLSSDAEKLFTLMRFVSYQIKFTLKSYYVGCAVDKW